MREVEKTRDRLADRLRSLRERKGLTQEEAAERSGLHVKHLQRLERGTVNATLTTLVACALTYRVPVAALLADEKRQEPFERIAEGLERPHRNAIPLYSLRAVAGRFGSFQEVEPQAWVRPNGRTRVARGLFVTQVVGESMNLRIPAGSFCVFRAPPIEPLDGKIVIAQLRSAEDPEQGGHYTVKRYVSRPGEIRLEPMSASRRYRPLVFRESPERELSIVAELVEVLR